MSDTIIINYPTDEGLTINIDDNDDVIVNIIDEPDIIVNLCDDLGTTANNYDYLDNKPRFNGVELVGNKTLDDVGVEPKRGIDDFYITNAEKTQGALATGNATLDTVKKVADYADSLTYKLIASFNPIVGTGGFSTLYDNSGKLLSDYNIKKCRISIYAKTNINSIQLGYISINDVNTLTYKQTGNIRNGIIIRNNAEFINEINIDFIGVLKFNSFGNNSTTDNDDATFTTANYQGINRTIVNDILKKIDVILGGGATFKENSIINIYVL